MGNEPIRNELKNCRREVENVVDGILGDYYQKRAIDQMYQTELPNSDEVEAIVDQLLNIVYPGYLSDKFSRLYNTDHFMATLIEDAMVRLTRQIATALRYKPELEKVNPLVREGKAREIMLDFFSKIPKIRAMLQLDLEAAFDGDPAAYNYTEIILAYPGLFAVSINRLAHELYLMDVPMIPRIMTEYAHSETGIDIHPGATIGEHFFIDHGTGIVIGETTTIGDYVKIYQGVTLGALSTRGGQKLRNKKRHPTIEDNVTIYAGASILGGETVVGEGSVIGSNVFLTSSVAPGTRVSVRNQELTFKNGDRKNVGTSDFAVNWIYNI